MTAGPSAPGTLLVQRLDAVLGTTLAQHAHLMTSARARAVAQTAAIARLRGNGTLTDPRHTERQHAHRPVTTETGVAALPTAAADASAHTHLSHSARLILALLAHYPERAPATVGRQPLWPDVAINNNLAPLTRLIPQALADAVAQSGLFYESHLAWFVAAERPRLWPANRRRSSPRAWRPTGCSALRLKPR